LLASQPVSVELVSIRDLVNASDGYHNSIIVAVQILFFCYHFFLIFLQLLQDVVLTGLMQICLLSAVQRCIFAIIAGVLQI